MLVGSMGATQQVGESRVARARKDAAARKKRKQKVTKEELMKALMVF